MRITSLSLVALLSACCAIGCEWCQRRSFEDDLAQRCARADAWIAQVDPPESVTGDLKPVAPGLRVIVTSTAVHVDNTSLVAEWWRRSQSEDPAAVFPGFEPPTPSEWGALGELVVDAENAVRIRDGRLDPAVLRDGADGLLIEPLYDLLKRAVRIAKRYAAGHSYEFDGRVNIYADRRTPFATLVKVIYTAGQAECERFGYVMQHRGKPVALDISHARCSPACGTRAHDPGRPVCGYPLLTVGEQGVTLRLDKLDNGREPAWVSAQRRHLLELARQRLESDAGPFKEGELPSLDARRPAGEWHGAVVSESEGACPSVGRVDGRIDLAALERLLTAVATRIPPCSGADVQAGPGVPWPEVARVLEVTRVRGGFNHAQLHPLTRLVAELPRCERVVTPAQIDVEPGR